MSDRTFEGRDITKTIVNLGVAGEIELVKALPTLATVHFKARGKVRSVKYVVKDDGTVKEQVILAIDPESFVIAKVQKASEQPELPLAAGTVTPEETDAIAERMGLRGPLLVSCENCGHGKGDHDDPDHGGRCLNDGCACDGYVAFAEPMAEEEMETAEGAIASTSKFVRLSGHQGSDGVPARVWEGTTASGIPVHAFITRIACDAEADTTEFARELSECQTPSAAVAAYPARLVL